MKHTAQLVLILNILICSRIICADTVKIDGVLDDKPWREVEKISVNYQISPLTLSEVNGNFYYKSIATENGLYLGIYSSSKKPLRIRTQEIDTTFTNDHIQVMLDINNTEQFSYVFSVNHQGSYYDGIYKQNKEIDLDWNGEWQFKTKSNSDSWIVEIYIPWESMSFSIQEENEFGLSVSRYDEATNSTYSSIAANSSMNSFLQYFHKEKVRINNPSKIDIFPYVSSSRDLISKTNSSDIGAEIFWRPSNNQQIMATLNPDFGQVESNELIVNFSAIESFFTEKRPFFNENQTIFDVTGPETLRVVHTPRIGGESYYDEDYTGTLNSALKYTYNHKQFDLGILSALESSESGKGGRDFHLVRGQYHFDSNKLGFSLNQVSTPSIERNSLILGTDFNYSYSEDTEFNIGLIHSDISEASNSIKDFGWWIIGSSEPTKKHTHEFSLFRYGNDLQLNDIGYVQRVNRKQLEYEYQYKIPDLNEWFIRDFVFAVETEIKTNLQNERLPRTLGMGVEVVTAEEFEYQVSIEYGNSGVDDLLTRGNNSALFPSFYITEVEIGSPEYDWGTYEVVLESGIEGLRGKFFSLETSLEHQINENMLLGIKLSRYMSHSWFDWDEANTVNEYDFSEQGIELSFYYQLSESQELRVKFESVIGKAKSLGRYLVLDSGDLTFSGLTEDFSFSESAFQLRYKYSLSKLTAFYFSYGFSGEYEDDIATIANFNLYERSINSKNEHNVFAKIRLHF